MAVKVVDFYWIQCILCIKAVLNILIAAVDTLYSISDFFCLCTSVLSLVNLNIWLQILNRFILGFYSHRCLTPRGCVNNDHLTDIMHVIWLVLSAKSC